jgi:hypothetical protein
MQQTLAVALSVTVIDLITGFFTIEGTLLILVPALLVAVLHPQVRLLIALPTESRLMTGLTAALAIPLTVFAVSQTGLQFDAGDTHAEMGHYGTMASFALVLVLWALIGSTRHPGWRFTSWVAAIATTLFGAYSLSFPGVASAIPTPWAITALIWGAAYLVVAERRAHRSQSATRLETPVRSD